VKRSVSLGERFVSFSPVSPCVEAETKRGEGLMPQGAMCSVASRRREQEKATMHGFRPAPGAFPSASSGQAVEAASRPLKRGFGPGRRGKKVAQKRSYAHEIIGARKLARGRRGRHCERLFRAGVRSLACMFPACWCSGGCWPRWFPRAGDPNNPATSIGRCVRARVNARAQSTLPSARSEHDRILAAVHG
jgi:hypothetical protein